MQIRQKCKGTFQKSKQVALLMLLATLLLSCSAKSSKGDAEQETNEGMTCVEVMYDAGGADSLEYVILQNTGEEELDLSRARLQDAVDYAFPPNAGFLAVGQKVVVASSVDEFTARFPGMLVFGPFIGRLSNEGEVVEFRISGAGDVDCGFSPEPPWPSLAAGGGHSLVYVGGDPEQPSSWRASANVGGNPPGGTLPAPELAIRINEILPFNPAGGGWLEIYNPSSDAVDLSGWHLSGSITGIMPVVLENATVVPAGGYLMLHQLDAEQNVLWTGDFTPSNHGGSVFLIQVINGVRTGASIGMIFPALLEGQSAGNIPLARGGVSTATLVTPTPGAANAEHLIGPVIISEIHYNPPIGGVEFLELLNITDQPVTLGPIGSSNEFWSVGGIAFTFQEGAILPAGGRLVLYRLDSTSLNFLDNAAIPEGVPVFGFLGRLSNSMEKLTVNRPLIQMMGPNGPENWSMGWSDVVFYQDREPWPLNADGHGKSLHRKIPPGLGDDVQSWEAGDPTPGR